MQMEHERPQTIALLLAHIPRELGASLLTFLPEPLAAEALYRFSTLDVVSPGVVVELRDMLQELLSNSATGGRRVGNLGGAKQAADILNHFQTSMSDMVLGAIDARDAKTADRIRENLFTFADLGKLTDRALQILLREVPGDKLAPALRLVDETLRASFYKNLSARQVEILKEELRSGPPLRRAEALAAQSEVVEVALRLAAEGRIAINATEEMV
jgi:flagellar motor switch protein FliG